MFKFLRSFPILILLLFSKVVSADEGMWLPQLLAQLNEKQMKALGMKISAGDIYNINKGSLKDAIVSFGGFCTGEVISDKGLVLTNHHCGFDALQNHSTLEHNYLKDGFWAKGIGEELPNPSLFVTFIVRIDDVTKKALAGVNPSMSESERQSTIDKNLNAFKPTVKKENYQEILIRPFYDGNKYYLFITETYKDVRLVGAPPSSIGNFGKDTDNWMWPRHTGDFSMFRIYASKDNKPASYSPDNVPYKPKRALSISLDGIRQNDFTMVFGFPGRTYEYLPAVAVEQIVTVNDPSKVAIREKALGIIDEYMKSNEAIKIQYAAKYASIENAYKKWQGEILGLTRTKAIEKKRVYEGEFQRRINSNPALKEKYGNLLAELNSTYRQFRSLGYGRDYYNEVINRIELFSIATELNKLKNVMEKNGEAGLKETLPSVKGRLNDLYKEYNVNVDKAVFTSLIEMYIKGQDVNNVSPLLQEMLKKSNGNYQKMADDLYEESDLDNSDKVMKELEKDPKDFIEDLKKDKAFELLMNINQHYASMITTKLNPIQNKINQLQREYMAAQMEVFKEKNFYPDANSTLRIAYGQVKGYEPRDGVRYEAYTDLEGVMEKYKPGDYEFDVPQKMIDLYKQKDYGQYGEKGRLPVCFIATNHTTGGNSGSPVLDAYGNLIGLNFDRVWEGTMSDYNYDPILCRNIMVDARYVLFIIDKFAGAKNLINELKLVHPKKK